MKMNFKVETLNLNKELQNSRELSREVLFRAMVKMEEIAKLKAPVDTGNLKGRIHLRPSQPGHDNYTLTDGVNYGIHLEYGTKPHMVPISPLLGWAGRVLGDPKAAYAVRNKISKKGTPARPFFRPALHEVKYKWLPLIKKQVFGQ